MDTLIVIPARFGSKRFPGKPLQRIAGHTLLERVVDVARRAALGGVADYVVATDDQRIAKHCEDISAPCVLTDPGLQSGTDRALAAHAGANSQAGFVVNLQGDAPFTDATQITRIIELSRQVDADVITPVIALDWQELDRLRERKATTPFSGTTCLRDSDGRAFWFSKTIVPAIRNESDLRSSQCKSPVFRHLGLYGYRLEALRRFSNLPVGHYEKLEGLEQLRFIENGMSIHTVEVKPPQISMSGIDTKEDLQLAEDLIALHGDPFDGR